LAQCAVVNVKFWQVFQGTGWCDLVVKDGTPVLNLFTPVDNRRGRDTRSKKQTLNISRKGCHGGKESFWSYAGVACMWINTASDGANMLEKNPVDGSVVRNRCEKEGRTNSPNARRRVAWKGKVGLSCGAFPTRQE